MQVLLLLTTDLTEKDSTTLDLLLSTLIKELNVVKSHEEVHETDQPEENMLLTYSNDLSSMATRSNIREMQLVILRLFSVLMSRSKSCACDLTYCFRKNGDISGGGNGGRSLSKLQPPTFILLFELTLCVIVVVFGSSSK